MYSVFTDHNGIKLGITIRMITVVVYKDKHKDR